MKGSIDDLRSVMEESDATVAKLTQELEMAQRKNSSLLDEKESDRRKIKELTDSCNSLSEQIANQKDALK